MIESKDNKLYKQAKSLLSRSGRVKEGLFLAEGQRLANDAILSGCVSHLLLSEEYDGEVPAAVPAHILSEKLFSAITETTTPQGIIAVCRTRFQDSGLANDTSFVLICDKITDPGNMGSILRTAEAAGVDAVVLSEECVDLYNSKAVRGTMGAIFRLTTIQVDRPAAHFKAHGFRIIASRLEESQDLYAADFTGKIAIVVGNEANGVSADTISAADGFVKIPMSGAAESLSVASAAAILLYEARRQRHG